MTAALIAEALAHAESVTPGHVGNHARGAILDSEGIERGTLAKLWHADEMTIEPGDGVFVRRDVVDAALAHLAERAERAEAALKAAEARIYLLRDTLYLIEGEFSASSERARLSRERDEALRDGAKEADRG